MFRFCCQMMHNLLILYVKVIHFRDFINRLPQRQIQHGNTCNMMMHFHLTF